MASGMKELFGFLLSFAVFQAVLQEGTASEFEYEYVTCGSSLKMLNTYNNVRLHSHDVKYGSGSGQQSVTGVDASDDHNSYWQVRERLVPPVLEGRSGHSEEPSEVWSDHSTYAPGYARNLHSHHFQSPLSHNLEVSAFGDEGEGDEGDNWVVVCNDKLWSRDERVRFKHVVTEHYLHVSGNSYGRPIHGQREISGYPSPNDLNYWQAAEGIFVTPTQNKDTKPSHAHDEF